VVRDPAPKAKRKDRVKPAAKTEAPAGETPTTPARPLAQDATLVTILRGAVEASARDDGWAAMSAAGSAAKRQAPIDPRNYGVKNFPGLFEATGLFEIFKSESGQSYVADKRNTDRSSRPNR
jgi:hypothetical protein